MRFVFVSEGSLYLKEDSQPAIEIESQFANEAVERAETRNSRQEWKGRDKDDPSSPYTASAIWGRQAGGQNHLRPAIRSVSRGSKPEELFYTVAMSASSGLFRYDLGSKEEVRLFHRQDFDACGLACEGATGQVALASRDKDSLGKLELLDAATRRRRQVTAGDGHDSNPSFEPGNSGALYFQSSGVARNEQGLVVAFGPAAIHRLDVKSGEMSTVVEDEHVDFIQPKCDAHGALHYIRRPYDAPGNLAWHQKLKAFVLLPFHLAGALFGFLDAFSRMFGKKSLRPAGPGDGRPVAQNRFVTFQDTAVALEQVLNRPGGIDDSVQLVPKTWELIRREKSGEEHVLAKHVVSFDFGPAGELIYSDGLRVWLHGEKPRKLLEGKIVQAVAAL